jgi:glycosyltransferase involved in cell wall biosynthesis
MRARGQEVLKVRVSIAMASYNGARFIGAQLESFGAQTRLPDELVVCDDGSTDGTPELVERFGETAPFAVRVERNPERLGYTGNFERAIGLTTGDLVCLSDQDDSWFPDKIATVVAAFEARPETFATVNDQVIAEDGLTPSGATVFANTRNLGYSDVDLIAGCCTSLRRELLPILLPIPNGIPYDGWIGRLADLLGVKALIERPLQVYRRHGGNTTSPVVAERAPTTWTMIRRFGLDDPRAGWRSNIAQAELYAERIRERRAAVDSLAGAGAADRALARLAAEQAWLERRLALLARPRLARLPRIAKLWTSGFYRSQFGLKSAIKDAIRR